MDKKEIYKGVFEKIKGREYAEEGIPVMLVLEDLTSDTKFSSGDSFENEILAKLVDDFEKIYREENKGELKEENIGKIIEAVCARYFLMTTTNS